MSYIDVTSTIERLEVFEERLGVSLESLSAFVQDVEGMGIYLRVRGEVRTREGTQLKEDCKLEVTVFDASQRIIGTMSYPFYVKNFFGFETFQIQISLPLNQVSKVRIHPKKR